MKKLFSLFVLMVSAFVFFPSDLQAGKPPVKGFKQIGKNINKVANGTKGIGKIATQQYVQLTIPGILEQVPPKAQPVRDLAKEVEKMIKKPVVVPHEVKRIAETKNIVHRFTNRAKFPALPIHEWERDFANKTYSSQAALARDLAAFYEGKNLRGLEVINKATGKKGILFAIPSTRSFRRTYYAPAGKTPRALDPEKEVMIYYPGEEKVPGQLVDIDHGMDMFTLAIDEGLLPAPQFTEKLPAAHLVEPLTAEEAEVSKEVYNLIYFKDYAGAEEFLSGGFSVNMQTILGGGTQLHAMIFRQAYDMIAPAIEKHGADLSALDLYGKTPLFAALNDPNAVQIFCDVILRNPQLFQEFYRVNRRGLTILDVARLNVIFPEADEQLAANIQVFNILKETNNRIVKQLTK